jgi:N-acetylglucosaminyldiphosphoundecaprenol N-acetyl-beta-D-mannosaminyltransferase
MIGKGVAAAQPRSDQARSAGICEYCAIPFHLLEPAQALHRILERDPDEAFAYVVTPNVDHVISLHASGGEARRYYDEAWLSLCDSAVLSILARMVGVRLPLITGSDLVEALFARVDSSDGILVIGCEPNDVEALRRRYGLTRIAHYNPPMGFIDVPAEVQACLDFVVTHPARFVFLAVGSPQQEIVANRLRHCSQAKGLGLCVGSALRFLSGAERRAPRILRGSGFEWLFRLAQDPRRLWRRYLVRDLEIFRIAARHAFASMLAAGSGSVARSPGQPRRPPNR